MQSALQRSTQQYKRNMSEQKQKEKPKKFLLPSSLKLIHQHYKNQSESFLKNLNKSNEESSQPKKQQKHQSLFKLNPSSSALVTEVPIETLRKRSKSQKLESLQGEAKESFCLLDHYKETQDRHVHEKKPLLKNYKIDIMQMVTGENKNLAKNQEDAQEEEKYEIVRPSEPQQVPKDSNSIFEPTIFQTPILPCFASEFKKKSTIESNKTIQEGQGLWRIGKIKVKGKHCELRIGQFVFQGEQVLGKGKAGVISDSTLHSLPNWNNMWVLQPHQSLFTND